MNQVLWQPSDIRKTHANITRFMELAETRFGVKISGYEELYQWSIDNSTSFWDLLWQFANVKAANKGNQILINPDKMPGAQWFPEARLNYAENLLKQHVDNPDCIAIIFHGENGDTRQISYLELYRQVSRLAQALLSSDIKAGDRVAAVLPNIPETVIAMLATASIGAVWSSCSPDFGVDGIVDRFAQIGPKVLFVCDGYYFNGKIYDKLAQIKPLSDQLPSIQKFVLVPYLKNPQGQIEEDLTFWQDYLNTFSESKAIEFKQMAFDDPLYILYSSGTTGPPKCIVHGVGGTLVQHLKEHLLHVDIHPGDKLFYYTTCGWMMWNWLASVLGSGATIILYEGSPLHPKPDVLFDLVDQYQINFFGTSAKYLDIIKKYSLNIKNSHNLTSLQTILSTGSPLAPESFDYVYDTIKSDICLSSISGGTDIISCFVLGCPILPVRRGEIQCRGLGMKVDVFDDNGNSLNKGEKGELVCTAPFPSMPIGFWNDPDDKKFLAAYFEKYPGVWWHGDYVSLTENNGMIIYGRSDTVLNPGGIRIGTAEIYRQVEQMDEVLESLVVEQQHDGDCRVILFVILRDTIILTEQLKKRIKQHIRHNASPHHVPALIFQVTDIPRTKSGKIVEQAVTNIIHQQPVNNKQLMSNPETLEQYQQIAKLINEQS